MRSLDSVLSWEFRDGILRLITASAWVTLEPLAWDVIRLTIQAAGGRDVLSSPAVMIGRDPGQGSQKISKTGTEKGGQGTEETREKGSGRSTKWARDFTALVTPQDSGVLLTSAATTATLSGAGANMMSTSTMRTGTMNTSTANTGTMSTGTMNTEAMSTKVRINFKPFRLEWYQGDHLFAVDERITVSKERISLERTMEKTEKFYGLGQKMGFLDRRGKKYEMWATDDPLHTPGTDPMYQSIPFFMALRGKKAHGFFLDCPARSFFDMGSLEPSDTYSITAESPVFDAYIFSNPSMKAIIQAYTGLTGRMEIPPLWALGYHQCRYSYYPESRVREIARLFREKDIPCDAIWLDIHYMDGYRVFTWDKERFPDPPKMIRDLAEEGFKTVVIVDPGVKVDPEYDVYKEGLSGEHFIKNDDGSVYVGEVWPGAAVFPDFLREKTRLFWGEKIKEAYLDNGVAGIWIDMNEPASFKRNVQGERTLPHDVLQGEDGRKVQHRDVHNLYGFSMAQATYEAIRRYNPDKRPFILTRSGYAGIQRYAAAWMGDNHSWWEHLLASVPICLGMGLSGVPFVGVDIGGFGQDATGELFARWMELGAFLPFFRGHSAYGTRDQEPWSFGPLVEEICRRYIKLRYSLLPLFYTLFEESSRTGLPVMRPLVLECQEDEESQTVFDEFLLGRDILVCPVYFPGQRKRLVYLPEGDWYNFWTGEKVEAKMLEARESVGEKSVGGAEGKNDENGESGKSVESGENGKSGTYIIADAPLDTLPVFVRAGALIPEVTPSKSQDKKTLTLHVYAPSEGQESVFELYEDEGDGYGYTQGRFSRMKITVSANRIVVGKPCGDYLPTWQEVEIVLHGFEDAVSVQGSESGAPRYARVKVVKPEGNSRASAKSL